MRKHRLDRLARLTQGAALLGISAVAACNNDPKHINSPDPNGPTEPIHVNATADPTAPVAPSTTASAAPSASVAPSASATTKPSAAPSGSALPKHINSVKPPMDPTHTNG